MQLNQVGCLIGVVVLLDHATDMSPFEHKTMHFFPIYNAHYNKSLVGYQVITIQQ